MEKPAGGTVTETGSSLLYPLFNLWAGGYNEKYPSVDHPDGSDGSGTGISDAENGTIDIGASDAYLSPSVVQANPHLKNIPLAISAQIVAYNVPGVHRPPQAERQGALRRSTRARSPSGTTRDRQRQPGRDAAQPPRS